MPPRTTGSIDEETAPLRSPAPSEAASPPESADGRRETDGDDHDDDDGGVPRLVLRVAGATQAGRRRDSNQDAFLVTTFGSRPRDGGRVAPSEHGGVLLLVCDGAGGTAGGGVAAHLAASAITLDVRERWTGEPGRDDGLGACLAAAVIEANRLVRARSRAHPSLGEMATTATAAGFVGRSLHVAHVGDSRAYLIRDGRPIQLTRDQTVAREMLVLGLLTPEEAARSPYRHVLARSLGLEPTVEPERSTHELEAGDVVLLCTDGLAAVVDDEETAHLVEGAGSPAAACRALISLVTERDGLDDVTVVVGRVEPVRSDESPPI